MSPEKKEKHKQTPAQNEDKVEISLTSDEELALCREQLAAESERRLRALAEAENVKKRLSKEKEEFAKYAAEGVLYDLLPVLDNLELAIFHGQGNEACKNLLMGVELTRRVFLETLARHGLVPFGAPGEVFDPAQHEAVGIEWNSQLPPESVARVAQMGYKLHGRLLRPAKVMVNRAPEV